MSIFFLLFPTTLGGDTVMAAETPDHQKGDLGCLEEVINGLIGADAVGHRENTQ